MNCSRERIEAWLDDELDAAERAAMERHVEDCAACTEIVARLRAQSAAIREQAPCYRAPAALRETIRGALRAPKPPARDQWRALAVAASVLLALSVAWNVLWPRAHLVESVLDSHLRSLAGSRLVDVPSSDQHAVKPWFAGKLDFSPEVRNLDAEGFVLTGGRVDYVAGERVAVVVYQRRQHIINLFMWPEKSKGGVTRTSQNGYNLLHWSNRGMTYWAISDVAAGELDRLRALYEQ